MASKDANMHHEYFERVDEAINKYGDRTIVLMQVGAFFEVYGYNDLDGGENESKSDIDEFCKVCGLNISNKTTFNIKENDIILKKRIMMAGFRDFTLDRYLTKLTDYNFTVVVYIQEKDGKKMIRKLDQVYSPGTYLSCDTETIPALSNNIMCIWLEKFKHRRNISLKRDILVCGLSVVNIFTGEVFMFQYETTQELTITNFDNLERFVSTYLPKEVLIIHDYNKDELSKIVQYSNINTQNIHTFNMSEKVVINCKKQTYIKDILTSVYNIQAYESCSEFQEYVISTQSLCYLFDFIQQHNSCLIKNLQLPCFNNSSHNVILANHTMSQLNIIDDNTTDSKNSGYLSSVVKFLNKCNTPMGKRLFQNQITTPTTDIDWLNREYNIIDNMMTKKINIMEYRKIMSKIKDMDKISRQLVISALYPSTLFVYYQSLLHSIDLFEQLNDEMFYIYIYSDDVEDKRKHLLNRFEVVKNFMEKNFILSICKQTHSMINFDSSIIQPGIDNKLDNMIEKYTNAQENLSLIIEYLNDLFRNFEQTNIEYVKLHETEKSASVLQMTNKRSLLFKKMKEQKLIKNEIITLKNGFKLPLYDLQFYKSTSTNVELRLDVITDLCKTIHSYKSSLNEVIANVYVRLLKSFQEDYMEDIVFLSKIIAKVDVLMAKTYTAIEYRYCKPEIVIENDKSFVNAKELRHCLIEQIQDNELYVVNDIELGTNALNGILLYGTNAVGKTSLIRALGIAVILAQCGMYVPCTNFQFKPYSAIFSRIVGNDNLFKGLSTFAVEMSELRTILNLSNENSLILGDELCSGTETESALSIFVSGLEYLDKMNSSFIFATHFHEIVNYSEIKLMKKLQLRHLEVIYDSEQDCLIYDRKLKDGSGPRIYGLEVCKSLHMSEDFINNAFKIRAKYFNSSPSFLNLDKTRYNAKKIRGICEVCKERPGSEIHHLQYQETADDDGYIKNFHKNHKANLISICEICHNKEHNKNEESLIGLKKKTTKGMKLI